MCSEKIFFHKQPNMGKVLKFPGRITSTPTPGIVYTLLNFYSPTVHAQVHQPFKNKNVLAAQTSYFFLLTSYLVAFLLHFHQNSKIYLQNIPITSIFYDIWEWEYMRMMFSKIYLLTPKIP